MPIEFASVSGLARAFGKVPVEAAVELRPALREGGERLMAKSQANASWSTRIPAAHYMKTSLSQTGGVIVGVDAVAAPHARPYEGLSSGGSRGFFRHPVFGDREVWVQQDTRPFLRPAVDSEGPAVRELISAAIGRAMTNLI